MQYREKYILQKILIFDYIFYVPNQNSEKKSRKFCGSLYYLCLWLWVITKLTWQTRDGEGINQMSTILHWFSFFCHFVCKFPLNFWTPMSTKILNKITTNSKISYFGFNYIRKSTLKFSFLDWKRVFRYHF